MRAINRTRGKVVAANVVLADTVWSRVRGLLGRSAMPAGEGLWIVPCSRIHTFFMQFSIDVIFLDKDQRVVQVSQNLAPWRMSPWVRNAYSVLEMAGGHAANSVGVGDIVDIL